MLNGVRQFAEEEQIAWIEQAEQIRDLRRAAAWKELVAQFAAAGVPDLDELAGEIEVLGDAARRTKTQRDLSQVRVRVAADGSGREVAAIDKWVDDAHAALAYLRSRRDPAYEALTFHLFQGEANVDSGRDAHQWVDLFLSALQTVPESAKLRLPPTFLAEGRKLLAGYVDDREQRHVHGLGREALTAKLHVHLADLVNAFDELIAARNFVTQRTGVQPVGLGLPYLRSAEGPAGGGRTVAVAPVLPALDGVITTGVTVG